MFLLGFAKIVLQAVEVALPIDQRAVSPSQLLEPRLERLLPLEGSLLEANELCSPFSKLVLYLLTEPGELFDSLPLSSLSALSLARLAESATSLDRRLGSGCCRVPLVSGAAD